MAVVNLKSTLLTNRDATPKVLTDAYIAGAQVARGYGFVSTGSADSAGSTYRLVSVPSGARLSSLEAINQSLGSGCLLDVSAWFPTNIPTGGGQFLLAASSTLLISSSTFSPVFNPTANTTYTQLLNTANLLPNYLEMPLWQQLGFTSDPELNIDIGFSVRVAVASSGYIGLQATYQY